MTDIVDSIRSGLARIADPAKAGPMQAYMKSEMPFRGVPSPERRQHVREVLAGQTWTGADDWLAVVTRLWDGAEFREERYAAIDLAVHRSAKAFQTPDRFELYDHWIVTGAWWDHVDAVSGDLLGPLLRAHRDVLTTPIRGWIRDGDMWRRRASIICQLHAKSATDTGLLADAIVANLADREFFIRKAIGWALRQHAKTDPGWVRTFVAAHESSMSGLSRREALKHLGG